MSRNYDNRERLVGAVLRREKDRRLAYCESFSSSSSADLSSRFSFVGDVHESADLCSGNIFFSRDVKAMEYEEIRKATRNFRADSFMGGGQYSRVFKGWIDENYVAAVKPGSGIAVAVAVENLHEGLDSSSLVGFVLEAHSCFRKRTRRRKTALGKAPLHSPARLTPCLYGVSGGVQKF